MSRRVHHDPMAASTRPVAAHMAWRPDRALFAAWVIVGLLAAAGVGYTLLVLLALAGWI